MRARGGLTDSALTDSIDEQNVLREGDKRMTNDKAMLFIGANRPIPGREVEAIRLWAETTSWLDTQQNLGWLTRWDGCWLTPHGGDMNCAFLCWGDRAKLDEWRRTEAFEAWSWRASQCLDGFGVITGVTWHIAKEQWERRLRSSP